MTGALAMSGSSIALGGGLGTTIRAMVQFGLTRHRRDGTPLDCGVLRLPADTILPVFRASRYWFQAVWLDTPLKRASSV